MNPSNIIKATTSSTSVPAANSVVKKPVFDANNEAQRILAAAEAQAERIRQQALDAAQQAHARAYQAGQRIALTELQETLLAACEHRDRVLAEAEGDLLRLAVRIAERIVGRELQTAAATIADIVATALQQARQSEMLTIHINPTDLPTVQSCRERLNPSGRVRFLELISDPNVERGGCLIETAAGMIDAQLSTQLAVLESGLFDQMPRKG